MVFFSLKKPAAEPSTEPVFELNTSKLKMLRDESLLKKEACVYFTYAYKQAETDATESYYRVKLSFTSTKLDHDLSQINVLNCSKDTLPLDKCLEAIDDIRRTKWFNVKLKPIANAVLIIRVMRDFCRRTPTWSVLSDWLLELVVEKCFVRNKYEKVIIVSNKLQDILHNLMRCDFIKKKSDFKVRHAVFLYFYKNI